MDTLLAVLALLFACSLLLEIKRFQKSTELQFKLFKLRDEMLWLAANNVISKEDAIRHYNSINWAVRYVREFPIFMLFYLLRTFRELDLPEKREELEKLMESLPDELREWYGKYSELIIQGIKTYTPVQYWAISSKAPFLAGITSFLAVAWFLGIMIRFQNHPLRREVLGKISLKQARVESSDLKRAGSYALETRQVSLQDTRHVKGYAT